MTPQSPIIDVLPDGEEIQFDKCDASLLYCRADAEVTVSDDGTTVTVETSGFDGTPLRLTYKLNQVFVEVAEYDVPAEEVEFSTKPASTSRKMVYGDPAEEADDVAVIFDGTPLTRDHGDFSPLWERADDVEPQEDFIVTTGLDDSQDPIPNQFSANWLLVEAVYADAPDDPFYQHAKYERGEN